MKEKASERSVFIPGGNVLLARSIRESELWTWDSEHLRLWIYLLTSVNAGEPRVIGGVRVGYGQVLKSYRKISDENEHLEYETASTWSTSRVKRMLDRFVSADMISTVGTKLGTLITIRNFRQFQQFASYRAEVGTEFGTGSEQVRNNNNQSIHLNPTSEVAKKKKRSRSLPDDWKPTESHTAKAVRESVDVLRQAEKFRAHHGAKGTKFVDWNQAFHNWLLRAGDYAQRDGHQDQTTTTQSFGSGAARIVQ